MFINSVRRIQQIQPCSETIHKPPLSNKLCIWKWNLVQSDWTDFVPTLTCDEVGQMCHVHLFIFLICPLWQNILVHKCQKLAKVKERVRFKLQLRLAFFQRLQFSAALTISTFDGAATLCAVQLMNTGIDYLILSTHRKRRSHGGVYECSSYLFQSGFIHSSHVCNY